jgi:hypothetical protein
MVLDVCSTSWTVRLPGSSSIRTVEALEQSEEEVAQEIFQALADLGPAAIAAVPALRGILRGRDRALHSSARRALRAIQADSAS